MRQLPIIAVILLMIFLLGIWGQVVVSSDDFAADPLQGAYEVLTLFFFEGEWTADLDLPWQLEVARFLAPLASVAGILVLATQGAWITLLNSFIRVRTDHVVVAGLGSRAWQFVQSCHGHHRLVIVEKDPENPFIARARALGMNVLVGDILSTGMFEAANLATARHLVAFTGQDGVNVELAIKARTYVQEKGDRQLLVHMHIENTRVGERLENYPKFFADIHAAQVNFFSIYHLNARILFRQYPPDNFAHYFAQDQVHIALYHFGRQAEHILLEAARVCHFANGRKVRFTVFDDDADAKARRFQADYPAVNGMCDISFVTAPVAATHSADVIDTASFPSVSEHVICLSTDADCLEFALSLRNRLLQLENANAPILVRMQRSSGLAQLLESNVGEPEIPDGLYPFGMLDEVLHYENVLADGLDTLARAFHEDYLSERLKQLEGEEKRLYATAREWNSIPEPERGSNRQAADHLETKLRAIGCALTDAPNPSFAFTDEEALLLAQMEQNRWSAEKLIGGWRWAEKRSDSARLNPFIGTFENLPPEEQQRNIEAIHNLPNPLAEQLGRGIAREVRIGVTGHRLNKFNPDDPEMLGQVAAAFEDIMAHNIGARFVLVSPLAEGADRLLAVTAMEAYGMALQAPLPLPFELYRNDFADDDSINEFKALVGRAESYFELPMRFGNQEKLSLLTDGASNPARNNQYALVGAWVAMNCEAFIAVYDGQPAAGTGGSGQVVAWRESGCVDPEFARQSSLRLPVVRQEPNVIQHVYEAGQ